MILSACLEVRSPIVYATLIIVAASVPVFLLAGLTGAFFRPLALSYTLAIAASMAVALTVTPALALLMLRGARIERRKSPLVGWLQKGYTAGLSRIVVRPVAAYATVAALTVLGIAVYPQLGQSLFPAFKEHDFLIHWVSPPGTSAAEMERSTTKISKELLAIPGVQSAGAHIGQALLGEEVAGVNLGEIWVSLAPNANYTATLDRIHSVTLGYPGLFREVQTYLDERISGGAHRRQGAHRRAYLRRGPEDAAGEIRPDSQPGEVRARRGRRAPRHLIGRPAGERDRQPGQGGEVRPQAGRCPPGRGDAGGRRGGR